MNSESSPMKRLPWIMLVVLLVAALAVGGWFGFQNLRKKEAPAVSAPVLVQDKAIPRPLIMHDDFVTGKTATWGGIVPHGTQELDGVTFVSEAVIRTAGLRSLREKKTYPGAILGMPIRRKATRIHLLQAGENCGNMPVGTPYGHLRFHLSNGKSFDSYLRYGIHGMDWFTRKNIPEPAVSDPNTTVCFRAPRDERRFIRIFHTILINPFPDAEILTMDAISPLGNGNILLFGISTDEALVPPQPAEEPIEDDLVKLNLTVQDKLGKPITNALVSWRVTTDQVRLDYPPFRTDSTGLVSLEFPSDIVTDIGFSVHTDGSPDIESSIPLPAAGWELVQTAKVTVGAQ